MIQQQIGDLSYFCKNMHKECPVQALFYDLVKHEAVCEHRENKKPDQTKRCPLEDCNYTLS